jgi:hypothetical protein
MSDELERVAAAWRRLSAAIAATRSADGSMPMELLAMVPTKHGPSFDDDVKLLDLAIPKLVNLALAVKGARP